MFDDISGIQITIAAVVGLIGLCTLLTWLPATRRDPTGPATRVFITVGLAAMILDPRGVGAVLGLSLAAMGAVVWWGGQPPPEVPRPRRRGFYIASAITGLITYATSEGWGPAGRFPGEARPLFALFVGIVALLATLAIADRARITFRDRLRRRFAVRAPTPRVLITPIDRPQASTVTLERLESEDRAATEGSDEDDVFRGGTAVWDHQPAAISAAEEPADDAPTDAPTAPEDAPTAPAGTESTSTAPDAPEQPDTSADTERQASPGPPPPPT